MSRIRAKNTRPEMELRRRLWKAGLRYRIHGPGLPGRPDIVFNRARVAVFADGCFWHACPRHLVWPKTRSAFWRGKIESNVHRDSAVNRKLRQMGWVAERLWEHEIEGSPRRAMLKVQRLVRRRELERLKAIRGQGLKSRNRHTHRR